MKRIATILLTLCLGNDSYSQILQTFNNTDVTQWILEGDGTLTHDAINGNPGGCLHFDDPATGVISVMTIPPDYLGIWNDESQSISFDLKVVSSDPEVINDFEWVIEISGPGGTALALPNYAPVKNTWLNLSIPVNSSNWTVVSGTWEAILASVNQVRIRVEYIDGLEDTYLDNIALSFTPGQNEISGDVCSDFETYGFDGWTFVDAGSISYSETAGNPGGAISIGDASNIISKGYAPFKFLGDWNVLGADAEFHFDLKVNTGSSNLFMQKEYLVKISGPGGVAVIPPDYVAIAQALNQWKTFTIPIEESAWTVTSGTWAGLMNNVQQLIIELEFIQGGETELLDNICLITDNAACTAESGAISPTNVTACAQDKYTMSVTGATADPSATFQWKVAEVAGGPYTNVDGGNGATTTSYTTAKLKKGTFYYVLETTCASGGTDLSNELVLDVKALPDAVITPSGPTTFCKGGSVDLNAPVADNRSYQWIKKDDPIAGATNASYTATGKGSYKVVVTNTMTGCESTSPSVKVTVNELPDAFITPQGPTTFCAGGSVVLQANTGSGLTYKWKKDSNNIPGATLSSYTATTAGGYKVEVKNADGCKKTSSKTTVTVPCKGGEDVVVGDMVSIFPNPASDEVNISVTAGQNFELEILNVQGEIIFQDENRVKVDVSTFAAGVYFIRVFTTEWTDTQKLVKQ